MTRLPTTARDDALALSTDLVQAGNNGGQGDGDNGCGRDSHHDGQPVPSFWNFIENEHSHDFGGRGHNQLKLMRYHA